MFKDIIAWSVKRKGDAMQRSRAALTLALLILLISVARAQEVRPVAYLPLIAVKDIPELSTTPTMTATRTATSTPSRTPTNTPIPVQLLPNGDFEQGATAWQPANGLDTIIIDNPPAPVVPRSGSWVAETITYSSGATPFDSPDVVVPADKPYLSYWIWIRSTEPICGRDIGGVSIHPQSGTSAPIDDFNLCAATQTDGWIQRTVDLNEYAGQTVMLEFLAGSFVLGEEPNSILYWDDIGFQAVP